MSEHLAKIAWQRDGKPFDYESYSRNHVWSFASGREVAASAAPDFLGDADRVDPEAAFVAAVASCHMLTFLAIAARKRLTVERYEDDAVGTLAKNEDGRLAVTKVVLRPRITFSGDAPSAEQIDKMHHQSHAACFIANSVRSEVVVEAP